MLPVPVHHCTCEDAKVNAIPLELTSTYIVAKKGKQIQIFTEWVCGGCQKVFTASGDTGVVATAAPKNT